MKIYLAGGFHSGWQDRVKLEAPQHNYFDPRIDADQRFAYRWTQQEIDGLKRCDLVFAYFESDNPSGMGLAKEIGWATILDKPVIYVDEHDRINVFLAACSQRIYSSFSSAVDYIKTLK
ncbi:MAG: nucleoside 2-deoxyribosyltransferase domain-containing protein [Gammaproteobacteria bacterium]|nr:nucleoside 2-deoxyribosyltransferase domain-containing protein [Gammaproteobacteria bacterium]